MKALLTALALASVVTAAPGSMFAATCGSCPSAKPAIDLRGLDAGQDRIRSA